MNNDFLAGILSSQTSPSTTVKSGKKHDSSESGGFLSLLQDRLAFDTNHTSASSKASVNFSFRSSSVAGDVNPLLINSSETRFLSEQKPVIENMSDRSEQTETYQERMSLKKTDDYDRKTSANSASDRDEISSDKAEDVSANADASESSKATQTASADAEHADAVNNAMQTLESLLASFGVEEQETLVNALQQMSPEDLEALAESPEEFQKNLLALIEELPVSEEQSALLELVSKPEFMNLLSKIADELQVSVADEESVADNTLAVAEEAVRQDALAAETEELVKVDAEGREAQKLIDSEAETTGDEVSVPETQEQQILAMNAQIQDADAKEAALEKAASLDAEGRATAKSDVEQTATNVEEIQSSSESNADMDSEEVSQGKDAKNHDKKSGEEEKDGGIKTVENSSNQTGKESLRQEFKRVNESQSVAETSVSETSTDSEQARQLPNQNQSASSQVTTGAEVKPAIEEVAKRFLSLLGEKTSGATGKTEGHAFSVANTDSGKKGVQAGSGSNSSSMSNGYAFQSGGTANANAANRAGNPQPVASTAFAELLDKAEFVKTKNGSKVLNLELDPKELGKVEMELTSKDGAVTARISAESTMAKAKLDELAPQIKEQLINQGVNLTEITVDISSGNPDERNGNQMSGGKNKSSRLTASQKDDVEAIIRKNVLPNLRRAALNIQAVDMTV